MPAGRPFTTGESRPVSFRARGILAQRLEDRRTYPDLRNDPYYGGPARKDGEPPAIGTVAFRDLVVFYNLLDAELADAAAELNEEQALRIVSAVWGLATDFHWVTNTPTLLAAEIEDAYDDPDEDGPDAARKELAGTVRAWPRLRALAVVEACLALRGRRDDTPMPDALVEVGLLRPGKGPR